jgi:tetratricopeptide (TPR) repeat protein
MQRVIQANARYWLGILTKTAGGEALPEKDLRGAARALEATLDYPDLWPLTLDLALALHPYLERRGYWSEWESTLRVLIERARQGDDEQAEARLQLQHGVIQRQRGMFREAVRAYRRAWRVFRRHKDTHSCAVVFSRMADANRLLGHFWRAGVLCKAALKLLEETSDVVETAHAANRLGVIYFDQGRFDEALPHLQRAEALWRQIGDRHGLAKTLQNIGELHRRSRELARALPCLEESIGHYLAVGDEIHAARTRLNIGNVYLNQGQLLQAEMVYLQAERVLHAAGDSLDLAGARLNLGMVYTRMKNWEEAAACFARALEHWRARGDTWREANTLGETGMLHLARGDRPAARSCLEEALKLIEGRSSPQDELLRRELNGRHGSLA